MASFDTGHKQTRGKPVISSTQFGPVSGFVLRWGALTVHMSAAELEDLVAATRGTAWAGSL